MKEGVRGKGWGEKVSELVCDEDEGIWVWLLKSEGMRKS